MEGEPQSNYLYRHIYLVQQTQFRDVPSQVISFRGALKLDQRMAAQKEFIVAEFHTTPGLDCT